MAFQEVGQSFLFIEQRKLLRSGSLVMQRGRARKSWRETIDLDLGAWHLSGDMVFDKVEWRMKLRTAVKVEPTKKGKM